MTVLLIAFLSHFIADFLLQSRDMAKQKSEKFKVLMDHAAINFFIMFFMLLIVLDMKEAFAFAILNALVHGVIDWNIWKFYKKYAFGVIKKNAQTLASNQRLTVVGKNKEQLRMEKLALVLEAKDNFKYWEDHWFYVTIGLDQLLHATTIIVLWGVICQS